MKEKFLRDQSQPLIEPTPLFWTIDAKDLPSHVEGNLVIAGVGTSTIVAILDSLNSRSLLRAERIILCPQKKPLNCIDQIQCLLGANYQLSHQSLVFEKHRHRHIFVFDRHPVDP